MRIFHENASGLDATDAPGTISEEHDVAAQALDGEIFVNRTNVSPFRLSHYSVKCVVGNRAATRDRR